MAVLPAIVVHPSDNVATALSDLAVGTTLMFDHVVVTVAEPIPTGHKIALVSIAAGDPIIKYGDVVGRATHPILSGTKVHVHNVADVLPELRRRA